MSTLTRIQARYLMTIAATTPAHPSLAKRVAGFTDEQCIAMAKQQIRLSEGREGSDAHIAKYQTFLQGLE